MSYTKTDAQLQAIATALRASTVPEVVAAMAVRNDTALAAWCNALSTTDAWNEAVSAEVLVAAMDFTKYDAVAAGKRDAWQLFLDYAPHDFGVPKNRKVIEDVWGLVDGVAVLQACTRKATNGEVMLGGATETRNTVSALDLNLEGPFSVDEVSEALNRF